ncbi:MAG: endonuclease Q family protein [Candidatus Bathyarchaeia archaeon]
MNIAEINSFAKLKGLNLVGAGDFTHPKWFSELKEKLVETSEDGLYKPAGMSDSSVRFMITSEVSTIFTFEGDSKKIHHVILTPSLETAEQINDRLAHHGDLRIDGRPTLDMSAPQLVEEVMEVSSDNVVFPAHAWTPWFSLFGAFSGFDRVEDCYQDMTKHIHAIETGLSSDPPMNWRLSALDRFTLVSNSDSHSSWPWRIGREANVLDLERFTYNEIVDAIRKKDPNRFKFTVETDPSYGKYHWTGHRTCGISLPPAEALKLGNQCPVCHRKLTEGVEQRVEELADRPPNFRPAGVPGYLRLLPLSEIISTVFGVTFPGVQKVWNVYNSLVSRFGDEYTVLIDARFEDMAKIADPKIAEAIIRVREEKIKVIPGYDGVYGQIVIFPENEKDRPQENNGEIKDVQKNKNISQKQKSLSDFFETYS